MALPLNLAPFLCYGVGLALTLALAAYCTPAGWWRRPTLRGLLIVGGGTWACGGALALAVGLAGAGMGAGLSPPMAPHMPTAPRSGSVSSVSRHGGDSHSDAAQGHAAGAAIWPSAAASACSPLPAGAAHVDAFRVHHRLNLRTGADVGSPRLAVIPAGTLLTPTGVRCGDWWQVRAGSGALTGWVSSLWLRRPAEAAASR